MGMSSPRKRKHAETIEVGHLTEHKTFYLRLKICIMQHILVFLSTIGVASASGTAAPAWSYGKSASQVPGPADWNKVAPQCAGLAQSPIDLDRYSLKTNIWEENLTIQFDNDDGLIAGTLINNGHTLTLAFNKSLGSAAHSGGPVGDSVYQLEQLQLHFGCSSFQGSEHTVSGSSYPVELGSKDNVILGRLQSKFQWIIQESKSTAVVKSDGIFLKDLVPALKNGSPYYTYQGSLTTPPCYQSVRWILLSGTAPFSSSQLIAFNRLQSSTGYGAGKMCNNVRPVQPRNGREVFLIY